ncbi:MAG: hypothetical protein WC926_03490 [Candidatus Paceibacterota bacterium]|jgi:hypothetical protein
MTAKNLNILLVSGIMLVMSLGCFLYLRPISYKTAENNNPPPAPAPNIEEPAIFDLSPDTGSGSTTETEVEDLLRTLTDPEQAEEETNPETGSQDETGASQACLASGGRVSTSLCCKSAGDFPNSCLIGACGCSPDNSKAVMICECGDGKCFDGTICSDLGG